VSEEKEGGILGLASYQAHGRKKNDSEGGRGNRKLSEPCGEGEEAVESQE
jgi:hypothetical protein